MGLSVFLIRNLVTLIDFERENPNVFLWSKTRLFIYSKLLSFLEQVNKKNNITCNFAQLRQFKKESNKINRNSHY
jgi:hypothetical protein